MNYPNTLKHIKAPNSIQLTSNSTELSESGELNSER